MLAQNRIIQQQSEKKQAETLHYHTTADKTSQKQFRQHYTSAVTKKIGYSVRKKMAVYSLQRKIIQKYTSLSIMGIALAWLDRRVDAK